MNTEKSMDAQMSADALYREDVFTDQRVGTVRRMTPVKSDGSDDPGRPVLYIGQATIMTPMGSLPLSFELPAKSLAKRLPITTPRCASPRLMPPRRAAIVRQSSR